MILLLLIATTTPLLIPHVAARWFSSDSWAWLTLFVVAGGVIIVNLWTSVWRLNDRRPLQWGLLLMLLAFVGLAGSLYPYIIPYEVTLFSAANDRGTLIFAGVGICIVLPVVILYLLLGYRVFRNRVPRVASTHNSPA